MEINIPPKDHHIMSEDALTHGVTVMECSKEYREEYYEYLLQQWYRDRISKDYFNSLIEGYDE